LKRANRQQLQWQPIDLDSLLQPLWRLRRPHIDPNLVSKAVSTRTSYPRLTLATRAESPQTTS
jgi:hypothetical protein